MVSTIEHFAKGVEDFQTAKSAFTVLSNMVSTWGGPDIEVYMSTSVNENPQPKLPGFDRFMMTIFSPLCWAIPSNSSFDPKDAQGQLVLGEAAKLQKAIYAKTGQAYLTYLRDIELSGMGMDNATIEEYLNALCSLDTKGFQRFFQVCIVSFEPYISLTDITSESCAERYSMISIIINVSLAMHCRRSNRAEDQLGRYLTA